MTGPERHSGARKEDIQQKHSETCSECNESREGGIA
jgi:hypothetical protein